MCKSAICAVVISRTQIYRLRLLVEIFSAVTERVVVRVERIPLAAKRVILIGFEDIPHAVRQHDHVAVRVLVVIRLHARRFRVNQPDSAEVHRRRASAYICNDIRPVPYMNRAADAVTQSVRTIGVIGIPYIVRRVARLIAEQAIGIRSRGIEIIQRHKLISVRIIGERFHVQSRLLRRHPVVRIISIRRHDAVLRHRRAISAAVIRIAYHIRTAAVNRRFRHQPAETVIGIGRLLADGCGLCYIQYTIFGYILSIFDFYFLLFNIILA